MKRLVFHFDVASPLAFLAFEHLPTALEGCSYHVAYQPTSTGTAGIGSPPSGASELDRAVQRARHLQIQLQPPTRLPFDPLGLSCLALACAAPGERPNRWVVETVMRHVWQAGGSDPHDAARLAALRARLQPRRDPQDPVVKRVLREELLAWTAAALASGVRDAPSFEVDAKVYAGLDTWPTLREALLAD